MIFHRSLKLENITEVQESKTDETIGVRANIHLRGGGKPSFARMDSVGGGGGGQWHNFFR